MSNSLLLKCLLLDNLLLKGLLLLNSLLLLLESLLLDYGLLLSHLLLDSLNLLLYRLLSSLLLSGSSSLQLLHHVRLLWNELSWKLRWLQRWLLLHKLLHHGLQGYRIDSHCCWSRNRLAYLYGNLLLHLVYHLLGRVTELLHDLALTNQFF